jgi:cytoskeleton protein RodZ
MTQDLNVAALSTDFSATEQTTSSSLTGSVGQTLRSLRLARGLSLDEVTERIKFSQRQIEALENEDWEKLPKGVSLRGLIRSYARLLETDEAPLVSSVESLVGTLSSPGSVHRESRTIPVAVGASGESRGGTSWGWMLVIIALVGVLAVYAFWQQWFPADWLPSWLTGGNP